MIQSNVYGKSSRIRKHEHKNQIVQSIIVSMMSSSCNYQCSHLATSEGINFFTLELYKKMSMKFEV